MKTILHKSESRGDADHGWLHSRHTFSFASYHEPDRMNFGVLRVLNDDQVAPGLGFGTHPHQNMEIISIPLEGDLEHKDSMGNVAVIKQGDIQVLSAGKGISHSERNKNTDREVKFLQIWIVPNKQNVEPRYDQITLDKKESINHFQQILSPDENDAGVWIYQDVWFYLTNLEKGKSLDYTLKNKENGVYVFVLEGDANVVGNELHRRDGLGVWDTEKLTFKADSDVRLLLMEVPMKLEG